MRIALLQHAGRSTVEENLDVLDAAARDAAGHGARLLIAPEMFLSGYNIGSAAIRDRAEAVDGPSAGRAAAIAADTGVALLYGYPERGVDGRVFNAALLVERDGRHLANHRKSHLFGALDRDAFSPGDGQPAMATLEGFRVGILICYEVEFPECVRLLALAGADLVVVPTALMTPYDFVPNHLIAARAYENQLYVAYANRCGREADLAYEGLSCVAGPDGADVARASDGEALIVADMDLAKLARSRELIPYLEDRRPDLYRALSAPTPRGALEQTIV